MAYYNTMSVMSDGGGGGSITGSIGSLSNDIKDLQALLDRLNSTVFQDDKYSVGRLRNRLQTQIALLEEYRDQAMGLDETRRNNLF